MIFQSGNLFEVTLIMSCDTVPEFQRRHSDQEIGKRDSDALRLALAIDLTGP